jgi:hypothetical protein
MWSEQRISTAVLSDFYTGATIISSKSFFNCTYEAEWTLFQTQYVSENLVVPGMEPGTSGSVARNSDH